MTQLIAGNLLEAAHGANQVTDSCVKAKALSHFHCAGKPCTHGQRVKNKRPAMGAATPQTKGNGKLRFSSLWET